MRLIMQPTSQIIADLGLNVDGDVQRFFTNECARKMDKYVPRDTGNLSRLKVIGKDYIEYRSPYAHYMYKGILYVDPQTGKGSFYSPDYGHWSRPNVSKIPSNRRLNYHTVGTGNYWDKRMWTAEGSAIIKDVENYMKTR